MKADIESDQYNLELVEDLLKLVNYFHIKNIQNKILKDCPKIKNIIYKISNCIFIFSLNLS